MHKNNGWIIKGQRDQDLLTARLRRGGGRRVQGAGPAAPGLHPLRRRRGQRHGRDQRQKNEGQAVSM